jgi:hypothetical protein
MTLRQHLTDAGLKAMSRAHRTILRFSGGRVLGSAFGMPAVELHTVGRTTGLPRSTMLTAPVIDGDRVVLVASKATAPAVANVIATFAGMVPSFELNRRWVWQATTRRRWTLWRS